MRIRLADDRRLLYFYVADVGPVGGQVWTDSSLGRDAVVHGQIPITGKEGDPSELLTEREILLEDKDEPVQPVVIETQGALPEE